MNGLATKPYDAGLSALCWVLGPGSVVEFQIADASEFGRHGRLDVDQEVDLSSLSPEAPATFRFQSPSPGAGFLGASTAGLYGFGNYRFSIIRFGSLVRPAKHTLSELIRLDTSKLHDARCQLVSEGSFGLVQMRGHRGYGSLQLVSRALIPQLLRSYPSVYSL